MRRTKKDGANEKYIKRKKKNVRKKKEREGKYERTTEIE